MRRTSRPPDPEATAELGRQLRLHVTASGRRMKDVAAAAGMDPAQLARITLGEAGDVRVGSLARIAGALGMELRLVPREGVGSSGDRAA
ncbi:MAG TPA: helix-turn-helix domain-containing protein [Acidimicrobiales bacterium]|nr:helix-turn-helix domain-containing protein [Acidimicrobiales bacterium]